jgi:hypothetical protein
VIDRATGGIGIMRGDNYVIMPVRVGRHVGHK